MSPPTAEDRQGASPPAVSMATVCTGMGPLCRVAAGAARAPSANGHHGAGPLPLHHGEQRPGGQRDAAGGAVAEVDVEEDRRPAPRGARLVVADDLGVVVGRAVEELLRGAPPSVGGRALVGVVERRAAVVHPDVPAVDPEPAHRQSRVGPDPRQARTVAEEPDEVTRTTWAAVTPAGTWHVAADGVGEGRGDGLGAGRLEGRGFVLDLVAEG